jgi:hypothetical protein
MVCNQNDPKTNRLRVVPPSLGKACYRVALSHFVYAAFAVVLRGGLTK